MAFSTDSDCFSKQEFLRDYGVTLFVCDPSRSNRAQIGRRANSRERQPKYLFAAAAVDKGAGHWVTAVSFVTAVNDPTRFAAHRVLAPISAWRRYGIDRDKSEVVCVKFLCGCQPFVRKYLKHWTYDRVRSCVRP